MERWVAKLIAGTLLFVLPLICTIIPIKMSGYFEKRGEAGKKIMGQLMCFGGGVFFSTFLLHMMPEVRTIIDESLLHGTEVTYPVAELLMGAGFFLVLTIETIAIKSQQSNSKSVPLKEMQVDTGKEYVMIKQPNHGKEMFVENGNEELKREINVDLQTEDTDELKSPLDESHHSNRSLVLAIALSLHRIFEGMSVGLKLTVLGVWSMFIAVICHEAIIGFSLGLQFMTNRTTVQRNLVYATLCSIIMPIGVAIGTALVEFGENVPGLDIANGILQAISTGTFIYVTFFEILHHEFSHGSHDVGKVVSLAFGFALMAAINAIPENDDVTIHFPNVTVLPSTAPP